MILEIFVSQSISKLLKDWIEFFCDREEINFALEKINYHFASR